MRPSAAECCKSSSTLGGRNLDMKLWRRQRKVNFDPTKYVGATKFQTRFRPFVRFFVKRLWKFSLVGFDQIPKSGAAILCANHISFLDSVFLLTYSPRNMSVVGKSEYMDSFKTRWLFTKIGMIPLDRTGGERYISNGCS